MAAGVTAAGLEIKTVEQILIEIGNAQLSVLGAGLDLSPDQPIGQLNGIVATKAAELWELGQTAYNAFNPNAAEGYLLDVIGLLRGVPRLIGTFSSVNLRVNLNSGTTLIGGVATANVTGDTANRWVLVNNFTAPSTGNFTLPFRSTRSGVINANVGAITEITTAVAGWNSVTNLVAATPGQADEKDADYRIRQGNQLSASGSGTVDSLRADLLALSLMKQVSVFENTTDTTNSIGLPAHSFEAVIRDESLINNNVIAQTLWDNKPAGIQAYGSSSGTATDALGVSRTVAFTRATAQAINTQFFFQTLPGWDPGQLTNILNKITAYYLSLAVGQDVAVNRVITVIMSEPFVWNVTSITLTSGAQSASANGTIAVDLRSYAVSGVFDPFPTPIPAIP